MAPPLQALKADVSHKRVSAFAKRLLQVAQEAPPNFACGCLFLLSELMKVKTILFYLLLLLFCATTASAPPSGAALFLSDGLGAACKCPELRCVCNGLESVPKPQRCPSAARPAAQARPALWNAVLQPEDNEQGEEHFRDADADERAAAAAAAEAAGGGDGQAAAAAGGSKEVVAKIDLGDLGSQDSELESEEEEEEGEGGSSSEEEEIGLGSDSEEEEESDADKGGSSSEKVRPGSLFTRCPLALHA